MVMKILYDYQIFNKQHYGGVSRYFCELMDRFSQDPGIDFRLALRYSLNEYLQQQPQLNRFWTRRNDFFSDSLFFTGLQKKIHINALNHIFDNRRESLRMLRERDFDIFHPTYYNPYFLDHLGKAPYILTIYDMIHEQYPGEFDTRDPTSAGKKILAENAKVIIAISENTKADIVKFLDIDPGKIQVIPLASSFNPEIIVRQKSVTRKRNLPGKYLLFIGNRFSYKNFAFLVEALFPVFKNNDDLHLICAGGGKFTGPEIELIRKMNMASRVHICPADDASLQQLYKNAFAFVFPSLYEGFGIPVLEAFSCGCPAILSNTSSLPEVGGDAALYFDPVDRTSLADAVERILSDERRRDDLIARGCERIKLFSWVKTAAMTKKVYEIAID
jgi:glycosyltransferase involved in cell wall biosynthesis